MKPVKINRFVDRYDFLSNFYLVPITYDSLTYTSSEAAFQAQKTTDLRVRMQFQGLSPRQAKAFGRKITLRPDWEEVKVDIMREVLRAKFSQNNSLAVQLLATYPAYLEEGNTWGDTFRGVCNGVGENYLGRLLMEVRDELRDWFSA